MANPEHLKILKQGVEVWNAWREENPDVVPDLKTADLSKANLHDANLSGANLSDVDLTKADLSRADLSGANLTWADLRLTALHKADLRGASLIGVVLTWTKVAETNFESADLGDTAFVNVDLSQAMGLDKCEHAAPGTIDHRTLQNSENLPIEFLRGCGLPDELIDWYQALHTQPIQFYSCFVSYSSKNQDFADRLYADLQDKGVRCWLATEDLKIGDPFRDVIDQAIRLRDKLLLILSEDAIASKWVKHEVEAGFEEEEKNNRQIMFPVRVDDAVMDTDKAWAATLRRERHIGDFTNWKAHDEYQKAFERLMRDLQAG